MNSSRIKAFKFETTSWQTSQEEILTIRHRVFMIEQHFSESILCDELDPDSFHIIVLNPVNTVVASGRLSQQGRIGRIAVLLPYRGAGIGSKILSDLVQIGKSNKLQDISLSAELDNRHFYDSKNFAANGPVYMKHGVPHQILTRKLA